MSIVIGNMINGTVIQDPEARHEVRREVFTKIHENRTVNPLRDIKNFDAIVLNVFPYNEPNPGTPETDISSIYLSCVVRPLIHNWLIPWPCLPGYVGNDALIDFIISQHPIARSTDTIAMGRAISITVGTRLRCFRPEGKGNQWRFDFTKVSAPDGNFDYNCLKGKSKGFNNGSLLGSEELTEPTLGATSYQPKRKWVATNSAKEDGTFSKGKCPNALTNKQANLPRKTTTFYYYSKDQVKDLVKAIQADEDIKKTMWCFTNKEQPFKNKGGQAMYPNNNPAGIQTDGGRPNGAKFITYQSCFKDSETWRAFAGFDNVEDGFKVLQSMVSAKYNRASKTGWVKPTGTIQQQAETLTVNYYKSWNTTASDAEIETLKKNNSFIRKGKKKGNWKKTVEQFKQSLTEWNQ